MWSSHSVLILLLFLDSKVIDLTKGTKILQIGEDCISVEADPEEGANDLELVGIYR